MNILVTGATGFIGRFLCGRLLAEGHNTRATLQDIARLEALIYGVEPALIEPIGPLTSWKHALADIDVVFHLAARVHVVTGRNNDEHDLFRKTNAEGTIRLAQEAARAGVKRFVFVSSAKVNGEESAGVYNEESPLDPQNSYGFSKMEAEIALRRIETATAMEVVIVRPPLVYGPGVKANFLRMLEVIRRGTPLPLASINNLRSFVYAPNLVDALTVCAVHPKAAGRTYFVSDGEDISTPALLIKAADALGVPRQLFPFPPLLLRLAGRLTGKQADVERLVGSLVVDSSKVRRDLGWVPPFSLDEGLRTTVEWFLENRK